ncbi:MAG: NUDIX hydrolase [Candidatus Peribacteraceae bacterium]
MTDVFRSCASIVVFRPAETHCTSDQCETAYEVLLLHKPRKNDAWQLPQGGREAGETIEEAAVRELKEEAGLEVTVIGKSAQVYQYDFPASYRRFRPDHVCGQRIEFVFAIPKESATVTVDEKEIDGYVWILPQKLSRYLKRAKYLEIVRNLIDEGVSILQSCS